MVEKSLTVSNKYLGTSSGSEEKGGTDSKGKPVVVLHERIQEFEIMPGTAYQDT